ncbi:MAG: type II toxin-antitoxin system VapC family toxin [Gammaproteobacteria bacterium]|nr:type II toxin-antitoxin system VapC family toxin [Gammaproteobacteria bacterium]
MILLDTHALIWMDADDPKLGVKARRVIQAAWKDGEVVVSVITFWECALLYSNNRIRLPATPQDWRADLLAAGLLELPLDGSIAILAAQLQGLHKDPADRFIAATAMRFEATLVTADARLLRWRQVPKSQDAAQ